MNARLFLLTILAAGGIAGGATCQTPLGAPWDSAGRILKTSGAATGGYYRYAFPRRDLTLRIGDVTVSPALALGGCVGFNVETALPPLMGDLVLAISRLKHKRAAHHPY